MNIFKKMMATISISFGLILGSTDVSNAEWKYNKEHCAIYNDATINGLNTWISFTAKDDVVYYSVVLPAGINTTSVVTVIYGDKKYQSIIRFNDETMVLIIPVKKEYQEEFINSFNRTFTIIIDDEYFYISTDKINSTLYNDIQKCKAI